jgi:uncharacterized protein YbjT (DUF2867 family)
MKTLILKLCMLSYIIEALGAPRLERGEAMRVLVIGATGRVAADLTKRLLADGVTVRGLVRQPDKAAALFEGVTGNGSLELHSGPFDDTEVLARAYSDVDVAFLALGTSPDQIRLEKALIDGAATARIAQLVRLSVFDADPAATYEVPRRHALLDNYLAQSGVAHTLLRPTYFSSNLLPAAASIAGQDRWFGTAPDGRTAVIDTRDVADAAAVVITDPALHGTVQRLTGPDALTFPEIAEVFSAVLGRPISYVAVPESALREAYAARGVPDWLTDVAIGIDTAMQQSRHGQVTPDLARLTGRPPRTVADFVKDRQAVFSPAAPVG